MTVNEWPARPEQPARETLADVLDAAQGAVIETRPGVEISADPISAVPVLSGELPTWDDVVAAGHAAARRWTQMRGENPGDIVNEIQPMRAEPAGVARITPAVKTTGIPGAVDVVVIGAGICGMTTAYRLHGAGLRVLVVDAGYEIGEQTTSWNNGMIHPGHDPKPGTLKAELNIKGNAGWGTLMGELALPFERRASLVVGFGDQDGPRLEEILRKAVVNGVPGAELIPGARAREIEPRLSAAVIGALYLPSTASVDPVAVAKTIAERMRAEGAVVALGTPVSAITTDAAHRVTGVDLAGGHVEAPLVVNAAGVAADVVAATAGSRRYSIHPRRGTLILFDPAGEKYETSVGPIPGEYSKGGGMTARPDGTTTGGPTAVDQQSRAALPPSQAEIDQILEIGARIYPAFPLDAIAQLGSEVRAATYSEDFIVGPAPGVEGLIDVAGTQSPALASAPAIAARVVDMLRALGRIPA